MKTAIDLSILFLVIFGAIMVAVGIHFKADVIGLASVLSMVAVLHMAGRSKLFPKQKKPEGRGLRATRQIKTIK